MRRKSGFLTAVVAVLLAFAGSAQAAGSVFLCVPSAAGKEVVSGGSEGSCASDARRVAVPASAHEQHTLLSILPHISFVSGHKRTIRFHGVNVQVVNGTGGTETANGLGNLIIGYNGHSHTETQTGSHNLVLGIDQSFTSYGGLIGGDQNKVTHPFSAVFGKQNTASGTNSVVSGGGGNTASGLDSAVSGGDHNTASDPGSAVSGGSQNTASGASSAILGGLSNKASGALSAVSGGQTNTASARGSAILGGNGNKASGDFSAVSGGQTNTASGGRSAILGGQTNTASGDFSAVSGGTGNDASGVHSTVSGGRANNAGGVYATVFGCAFVTVSKNEASNPSLCP